MNMRSTWLSLALLVLLLSGCGGGGGGGGSDASGTFTLEHALTVTTSGLGSVTRNPDQSGYSPGSQVQLTAVPQPGSQFSFWSGDLTGNQNPANVVMNSDKTITANFVVSARSLTVVKSGLGSGTVTGSGINCGTDCTETYGSVSVVLTATAAAGSTFGSWTGCDSTSTNTCTVDMRTPHSVTATFNLASAMTSSVSVASSSTTGSYSVTVTCTSGTCSSVMQLQEAPNTSFTNPTTTTQTGSNPMVFSFANKPNGQYCYRGAQGATQNWSTPACITVARPTSAVLRIINNSSYDLVDVRLNGSQHTNYPYVVLAGNSYDVVFSSAGTVNYALGNGFYNQNQTRDIWFTLTGVATLTAGQTSTVTFNNPTIGDLLTSFSTSRNWDGQYFDASINSRFARYRFTRSTNGWQLFDSTGPCFGGTTCSYSQLSSGTARLVNWPRYSAIVTFDFGPGSTQAQIAYPFGTFQYRNGPASWPIIEYVRQ